MSNDKRKRYRVEVRPNPRYNIVLYMIRLYREKHGGPFTDDFDKRLTWERRESAERKIVGEQERGFNRVWGHLTFTIVEEHEDEGREFPGAA